MTMTEAKWRALIATQEKSGLSVRAFAEARGIPVTTLYWWRSRLARGTRAVTTTVPALVRIAVRDEEACRLPSRPDAFELRLRGGIRVRVPARFEDGDLRRLLEVLQRC